MESGLRPATVQLENRRQRFSLRLLSLPDGDQVRDVVGAVSVIGKGLKNALAHSGRTETTVLLEEPEALDAETIQEDEASGEAEAERMRPGITMFTDGSRLDDGATGYAVVWKKGESWVGVKTTWDTTKKPMTQNVRPSRKPSTRWQDAAWYRNGSPSSPTPKPPSGEWHQRNPAPDRNTQSSQDSIS